MKGKRYRSSVIRSYVCSIPYNSGIVTIDMATTIHAVSGIIKALVEGKPMRFPV